MPISNNYARSNLLQTPIGLEFIELYSGPMPLTGDTPATGTPLVAWFYPPMESSAHGLLGFVRVTTPLTSEIATATGIVGYARLGVELGYASVSDIPNTADITISTRDVRIGERIVLLDMIINIT